MSGVCSMRSILERHAFSVGLLGAILLAFAVPELGARGGPLRAGLLTKAGVMLVFLLQGLMLRTGELLHGVRDLRLQGFINGWIFVFSALPLLVTGFLFNQFHPGHLADGFLYLALLPTTVFSAVGFTAAAGGNVAAAIFSATVSNAWGVFWVPAGCLLLFSAGGGLDPGLIGPLLGKLALLILAPLLVGQVLRPFLHGTPCFGRVAPRFKTVNHAVILFIVYAAFCESVQGNSWRGVSAPALALLLLLTVALAAGIHAGVWWSGRRFLPRHGDRVAALFCGAQKSLATGAPMAMAIFAAPDTALAEVDLGLLLLPLLCYHPVQLLMAALLLPRLERGQP